jgi:tRNA(Ile)-lysidine synthase TilS/MesJ
MNTTMKPWLVVGWGIVIVLALANIRSFMRAKQKQQERQGSYRAKVDVYRSILKPGITREQVEAYLRQTGAPYQRSCCEAGDFSDRTRIGHEAPGWVCRNWDVYVEFKFAGAAGNEAAAAPGDTLQQIDLFQNGSCL